MKLTQSQPGSDTPPRVPLFPESGTKSGMPGNPTDPGW